MPYQLLYGSSFTAGPETASAAFELGRDQEDFTRTMANNQVLLEKRRLALQEAQFLAANGWKALEDRRADEKLRQDADQWKKNYDLLRRQEDRLGRTAAGGLNAEQQRIEIDRARLRLGASSAADERQYRSASLDLGRGNLKLEQDKLAETRRQHDMQFQKGNVDAARKINSQWVNDTQGTIGRKIATINADLDRYERQRETNRLAIKDAENKLKLAGNPKNKETLQKKIDLLKAQESDYTTLMDNRKRLELAAEFFNEIQNRRPDYIPAFLLPSWEGAMPTRDFDAYKGALALQAAGDEKSKKIAAGIFAALRQRYH